jgi:peptidoglycan/xylan/chitin deacetylase (PgdA/CDA1 family)
VANGPFGNKEVKPFWESNPNVFWRCTAPGKIALTFDDGPTSATSSIVNTLNANGVKATFFVHGHNTMVGVAGALTGLKAAFESGHLIANHGFSGAEMTEKDAAMEDLLDNEEEINPRLASFDQTNAHAGAMARIVRPPKLTMDGPIATHLGNAGFSVVQASIDTVDWCKMGQGPECRGDSKQLQLQALTNVLDKATPTRDSFVHLAHDVTWNAIGGAGKAELVQDMVDAGRAAGYTFVTVDECIGIDDQAPKPTQPTKPSQPTKPKPLPQPTPTPTPSAPGCRACSAADTQCQLPNPVSDSWCATPHGNGFLGQAYPMFCTCSSRRLLATSSPSTGAAVASHTAMLGVGVVLAAVAAAAATRKMSSAMPEEQGGDASALGAESMA